MEQDRQWVTQTMSNLMVLVSLVGESGPISADNLRRIREILDIRSRPDASSIRETMVEAGVGEDEQELPMPSPLPVAGAGAEPSADPTAPPSSVAGTGSPTASISAGAGAGAGSSRFKPLFTPPPGVAPTLHRAPSSTPAFLRPSAKTVKKHEQVRAYACICAHALAHS